MAPHVFIDYQLGEAAQGALPLKQPVRLRPTSEWALARRGQYVEPNA